MTVNYIHWNIDPEIINIFGISLRYYGILFVGGLILCIYILKWIFKNENIPLDKLEKLSIYGLIGIFAGARLGHCLLYEPSYYFNHPLEIILPIQPTLNGGYGRILGRTGRRTGQLVEKVAYRIACRPAQTGD